MNMESVKLFEYICSYIEHVPIPCSSCQGCICIQCYGHTVGKIKVKGHGNEDLFSSVGTAYMLWNYGRLGMLSCIRAEAHYLLR